MDRKRINIKEEDIGNWNIPPDSNHVIIEITERSKDKVTKGGIYVGYNEDVVYAEGAESHEADVAEVWGTLVGVPHQLHFDKHLQDAMPWDTDIQAQIGDTVWFDYLGSVNCDELVCGDRTFYVINYEDLYVAKRGDEIIPLNGYCLCSPMPIKASSELEIDQQKHYLDRVRIRHLAKKNRAYRRNDYIYGTYNNDDIDIKEGDVVLLRKNYTPYRLERLEGISTFSEEPYFVVQRRNMEMVLDEKDYTDD